MTASLVVRETADAIAVLTLDDPARLNALSTAMISALRAEIEAAAADPDVRVIVLRGAGKAFCAGHDLSEMSAARQSEDSGRVFFELLFDDCAALMKAIRVAPQPVIAEVGGVAVAAGCQLVASCDLAVAAEEALFGVNGVNIGLFCSTPMVALTRNVGRKAAFEMLTTGALISASRAAELGLVNRVVAHDDLAAETHRMARTIAGKLGPAVALGKRVFHEQADMDIDAAYAHAGAAMIVNMLREDTAEGVRAFLEKRPPDWEK